MPLTVAGKNTVQGRYKEAQVNLSYQFLQFSILLF